MPCFLPLYYGKLPKISDGLANGKLEHGFYDLGDGVIIHVHPKEESNIVTDEKLLREVIDIVSRECSR